MTTWLVGGLGALLALQLLMLANLFLRVRGMILRRPRWRVCGEDEVPGWLRSFAAPAVERLTSLGFEPRAPLAAVTFDRQTDSEGHDLLFEHPETGAWAFVYMLPVISPGRPLFVDFVTWSPGGGARMTLAAPLGVADTDWPDVEIVPLPSLSLGRRWVRHRFETEGAAVRAMTPEAIAADLQGRHAQVVEEGLRRGTLRPQPDGTLRYSLRGALSVTRNVLRGLGRGAQGLREFYGAYGPDRLGETAPPPHQARIHEELLLLTQRRGERAARFWLFLVTMALFAVTLGGWLEPAMVGLLVAVLLLHEAGHFQAMRLFGYRETAVYFLPLLGAAASGTKPEATLSERAAVFLAGPLPGLAAGVALIEHQPLAAMPGWLQALALMLIYVNLFNLLPVLPLDGGRLVERVLLSPYPRGEVVFKALSAGTFLAGGVLTREWVLALLGAFIALNLRSALRLARAMVALAPGRAPVERSALYAHLDALGYGRLPFGRKFTLARELEQRLAAPVAAPGARLAWFAFYLVCLGASLAWARALFFAPL